jgi:hypothetical protein
MGLPRHFNPWGAAMKDDPYIVIIVLLTLTMMGVWGIFLKLPWKK